MRKTLLVFAMLFSVYVAYGDGQEDFNKAETYRSRGEYKKAEQLYISSLSYPNWKDENIKDIERYISICKTELRKNAQIQEDKKQEKLKEREQQQLVYITVNATETGILVDRTTSAMSEVMRINGKSFNPNIDEASTVVTVFLNINPTRTNNGFYKAGGNGTVLLGDAITGNYVGKWYVDSEATSAVGEEDAKRLLQNKLNHKLGYALDNLLNGRPQSSEYYIPDQSLSVYFDGDEIYTERQFSFLLESLNSYITRNPDIVLSTALNEKKNKNRDKIAAMEANVVKMESRAPIHELDGFKQVLTISVMKDENGSVVFSGEIEEHEHGTGRSITTVTINGADFDINRSNVLNANNQRLVAKLLAVGLGFKEWKIGEDIGGYRLASFDGIHGLIIKVLNNSPTSYYSMADHNKRDHDIHKNWRYPSTDELKEMFEHKKELNLSSIYWSANAGGKNTHETVDFSLSEPTVKTFYYKKSGALTLLVKQF